ncbi:hypothetical protein VKT23_019132 [Stygiomarasmius scandens]|uniref:Uncharacterized protein n=1 Tax=Marasmiellus scandens TaxID=2682957 RepID=A0ABR1INR5_9AGAR
MGEFGALSTVGSSESFVVIVGVNDAGRVWVDIITDIRESLQEIYDSYNSLDNRADVCSRGSDEVSQLFGDKEIRVTTTYVLDGDTSGNTTFEVGINFTRTGAISRSFIDVLPVPILCGLGVIIKAPFEPWVKSLPRTLLNTSTHPYSGYLAFNNKGTSGLLVFSVLGDDPEFSVVLKLLNVKLWAEVHSRFLTKSLWTPSSWIQRVPKRQRDGGVFASIQGFDIQVNFTKPDGSAEGSKAITDVATVSILRRGNRAAHKDIFPEYVEPIDMESEVV